MRVLCCVRESAFDGPFPENARDDHVVVIPLDVRFPAPEECALNRPILVRSRFVDQPVSRRRDEHRALPGSPAVCVYIECFNENATVTEVVNLCAPVVVADVFELLDELAAFIRHGQGLDHQVRCFVVHVVQHGVVPL